MLTRPIYSLRLVFYRAYELAHPDEPWISQGAVRFLDANLDRKGSGLEWGSGRSTTWFAKRLGSLTSVEHDRGWAKAVRQRLAAAEVRNIDYLEVPLDHPQSEETKPWYDREPRYVAVAKRFQDSSLCFALVDGHYRQACIRAVIPKLRPGALLVVDNTDWLPLSAWGVPSTWPLLHQSRNVRSQTTIWEKASATP
jgi:Methyltransferase domain